MEDNKIKMVTCKMCRDKGLKGGCSKCGKFLEKVIETPVQQTSGIMTDDAVIAKIPEFYRGRVWDKNELISDYKELDGRTAFNTYVTQLDKIQQIFMEGKVPNKSAIIIAPRKMSKQTWANSCIQFGMKHKYKMLPVLSSNMVKRALANSFDRPHSDVLSYLGYNIEDIMTADCLFVTIDSGWQRHNAFSLIDELMCMRASLDRPTIFISRYSIEDLTKNDYERTFMSAIDIGSDVNRLRYPAVIQCDV